MFGADVEKVLDESLSRLKPVVAVAAMGLTPMLPVMADAGTDASLGEDGEVAGKAEKHGIGGCCRRPPGCTGTLSCAWLDGVVGEERFFV